MNDKGDINQDDMDPNSKEVIKNDSKRIDRDAQTDPGEKEEKNEEQKIEVKIFDYLSPSDEESIPFNPSIGGNIIEDENDIYKDDDKDYKYVICILLKDNTNSNCLLLEETLKGIITNNLGGLSTLQIEPKDIYISIFVNQTVEDEGNYHLLKKESLKKITEKNNFLLTKQTIKDENREIRIDVICKKDYMTDIESLKCFYNYTLYHLKKKSGKPIVSSIITAGVIPYNDSLKKLIQIAFHSNAKNQNNSKDYAIAVPALEVNDHKNLFIKLAQYDRAHFNIYNMSFYSGTAAVPISSLLNTMIIDNILMKKLKEYYKIININSTIDYHDYNLALNLYRDKYKINYYCNDILGAIVYFNNFNYMDYKDLWVNKFSGYYGNFFEICKTFGTCNGLPIGQKIFMLFQIIGLLIEFIYPSLSILVIYSIFYEAFLLEDILPAVFMTMLYILMYLGSGACSMITNFSNKMQFSNLFFFIFMEVYYLFIIICSIPAMNNIKKKNVYKTNNAISRALLEYLILNEKGFNTAACACLIIFTFIIGILPIILKIKIISKNFVQMFIYLFIGAPSSTSNFLIAKIWKAPETSGGENPEERKGITIIFFFLFNLFIGFLSFYNFTREKRSNCVMGLSIFYLIYLFFKVIGLLFPLLSGCQLISDKDNEIIEGLSREEFHSNDNNNELAKSTDKLKKSNNSNENEEKLDNDDNINNEENNENKSEHNDENNDNENNNNDNENNNNENNNNENENNDNDNNNNTNNDNENNDNDNNNNENNENNNENNDNENNDNSRNLNNDDEL